MDEAIQRLNLQRFRTFTDLVRVERRMMPFVSHPEVNGTLRDLWLTYVNSNNLLSELRNLTTRYPFSSECLDEAKELALIELNSSQSWNYCWLTLTQIEKDDLVSKHARTQAQLPEMWGGNQPTEEMVNQLCNDLTEEWAAAVKHLLRQWETPPVL